MKHRQLETQRHPDEDVVSRLNRLKRHIDTEPFAGWLSKPSSLDRLHLLHRIHVSDEQFVRAICALCMWAPEDYIGDSSVLSTLENTVIGS